MDSIQIFYALCSEPAGQTEQDSRDCLQNHLDSDQVVARVQSTESQTGLSRNDQNGNKYPFKWHGNRVDIAYKYSKSALWLMFLP